MCRARCPSSRLRRPPPLQFAPSASCSSVQATYRAARLLETLSTLVGPGRDQTHEEFTRTCRDLDDLRQRARQVEQQRVSLRDTEATIAWVTGVLADFDGLWKAMTPENRRRLVAALVQSIVVDEDAGAMEITFADDVAAAPEAAWAGA